MTGRARLWHEHARQRGIYVPGGMERDFQRFPHTTQSSAWFNTYELFHSRTFPVIFSDRGGPWVAETTESKTTVRYHLSGGHGFIGVTLSQLKHKIRIRNLLWSSKAPFESNEQELPGRVPARQEAGQREPGGALETRRRGSGGWPADALEPQTPGPLEPPTSLMPVLQERGRTRSVC